MSGIVKTGQAVTAVFTTAAPTTGAATNADSLPTGVLYVNGTANGATVTVTNITTGRYKAAVTLPSLAAGDVVDIHIAATVGGVVGGGVVWSAVGDTNRISDSTPQTGDSFARIPGVLQTKAEADTAHGLLATAAAIAALNNLSSAQAQTAAAAALTAYDPPTQAELTAGLAAADDSVLAAIAARPSVADFWSGITATAARFIADHTLRRSWASAAVSANGDTLGFRSLLGAVAKLVNRVGIGGATLTVYQDDDTTALGTQTVTSDAAAEPITQVNTV